MRDSGHFRPGTEPGIRNKGSREERPTLSPHQTEPCSVPGPMGSQASQYRAPATTPHMHFYA